jgi:hypothetical protein
MAGAAVTPYPAGFPCAERDFSTVGAAGVVRSPLEAGASRQRRAFTGLPHRLALSFVMDQPTYNAWLAWVNAHAFDDWITLALPGVAASRAGTTTAPVPVRFVSDLAAELLNVHRLWFWRVRVEAEWMPTAEDLAPVPFGAWIVAGTPGHPSAPDWIIAGKPATPSNANRVLAGTPAAPAGWL